MSDAITSALISGGAGILGAIVGGYLTVIGTRKAIERTSKDLERTEVRKERVKCIVSLSGLTWVTSNSGASDDAKSKLLCELNKASTLWGDDPTVTNQLRDLYFAIAKKSVTDQHFVNFLKSACISARLPIENLSDGDFLRVFQLQMRGN